MHFKSCRCGKIIPLANKTCPACAGAANREYDKQSRDQESKKFYQSKNWKWIRKVALQRDMYQCQECKDNGIYKEATIVDHVLELVDRPDLALSLGNLRSLCHGCHNTKSHKERKKRSASHNGQIHNRIR